MLVKRLLVIPTMLFAFVADAKWTTWNVGRPEAKERSVGAMLKGQGDSTGTLQLLCVSRGKAE